MDYYEELGIGRSASVDEIRNGVIRYLEAGVDTAFLQLATNEPDPARRRQVTLDALHGLAPGTRRSS